VTLQLPYSDHDDHPGRGAIDEKIVEVDPVGVGVTHVGLLHTRVLMEGPKQLPPCGHERWLTSIPSPQVTLQPPYSDHDDQVGHAVMLHSVFSVDDPGH